MSQLEPRAKGRKRIAPNFLYKSYTSNRGPSAHNPSPLGAAVKRTFPALYFLFFFFHLTCSLKPKEPGFVAILDESEARCVCSERENSFRDDSSPAAKQPPSSTPTQTEFKTCKKKTEKKGAGRRLMLQKISFRVPNKKRGGFHISALKKKRISASDKRPAFQFKSVTFDNFFSVFFFFG